MEKFYVVRNGGSAVVQGPTVRVSFILESADDRRPEELARMLNDAWNNGYGNGKLEERQAILALMADRAREQIEVLHQMEPKP